MTKGATQFVTPLTFRALSGHKVYVDMFDGSATGGDFDGAFDHILVAGVGRSCFWLLPQLPIALPILPPAWPTIF
jgi:phosphopantothenoylcysteine synthetase/decarboxylase